MSPQPTPELIFDLRELYKCNTDPHGNKLWIYVNATTSWRDNV
jgi:hypothetical protein